MGIGWSAVEGAEGDSFLDETEDEEGDSRRVLSIGGWTMTEGPSVDDSLGEDVDFDAWFDDEEDDEDRRLQGNQGTAIGCEQYPPPFVLLFCPTGVRRRNLRENSAAQLQHTMHELRYRSKKLIEVALADICNDLVRDCVDFGLVESLEYPTCGVKVRKIRYEVEDEEED